MATDERVPEEATDETTVATNEVAAMTADGEMTIVDSEMTVGVETTAGVETTVDSETTAVGNDNNAARSTITIGPVQNARTPISPSETSAIVARPHGRVAAVAVVDDEIATTVEAGTTVDSETTVEAETTADSETTVGAGTTVDSETTVVGATTGVATDNNVERSPTTIGPVLSVRIPISPSEMSATGVRNLARVVAEEVADDETIVASAPTAINKGTTTVAEAAMVANNGDAPNKAVVVLAHNIAGLRMFNPAEPGVNAQAMHTINHRAILERRLGSLSAKMTERT